MPTSNSVFIPGSINGNFPSGSSNINGGFGGQQLGGQEQGGGFITNGQSTVAGQQQLGGQGFGSQQSSSVPGSLQSSIVSSEFGSPNLNPGTSELNDSGGNTVFSANPQGSFPPSSTSKPVEHSQLSLLILLFLLAFVLLVLCLLLFLFFCLRRRNARSQNRRKLLTAVPPSNASFLEISSASELGKMGLGHLWWSGKAAQGGETALSHEYVVNA